MTTVPRDACVSSLRRLLVDERLAHCRQLIECMCRYARELGGPQIDLCTLLDMVRADATLNLDCARTCQQRRTLCRYIACTCDVSVTYSDAYTPNERPFIVTRTYVDNADRQAQHD